ncbi:putative aminotransferase [Lyophyllum shimeji]|uniref:Aminotransferase n=1 Tax=Lyophyllum shimeji TaxID=47721 RepID=A0A9P3PX94_LYOSH|nr:putative aminotransferase [Lyophyllum shimeji]
MSNAEAAGVPHGTSSPSRGVSGSGLSLHQLGQYHVTNGIGRLTEGIMTKGQGSYVEYDDGKRYLDFTSGIGVTSLGHCHPKVSQAAAEQCLTLVHAQCSIAFHKPYLQLVERLLLMMPHPSLNSFFFWNSGSEAVEAAIKLARVATGRQNIICMQGAYHGRTFGASAVTRSKTIYSEGTFPLMPGVFSIPYPYWHQHGLPPSTPPSELASKSLYQLDLVLAQQTTPRDTAAIIVEPLLGEGGYVPAPPEFLQGLRDVCDKHGIMLIVDEVQSGFARTGKYFMIEHSGVRPDIMVIAKGLANGFPLSGVISRKELTDKLKPGTLGGTYAGNAVSCAAAVAVADAFKQENILTNVQERSRELFAALESLRSDPDVAPYILDVRGRGLMVAIEFTSPNPPGGKLDPFIKPDSPKMMAQRVVKTCVKEGLLILTTSAYEVVRFIPPLNISPEELKKGMDIFTEAVKAVVKEGRSENVVV